MINLLVTLKGILFTMGLIAGIGPQSLYLIEQSLKKDPKLVAAFTCCISDVILFLLSAIFIGLSRNTSLIYILDIIGVIFVFYFIIKKLLRIFLENYNVELIADNDNTKTMIIKGIIFTWFNPIVYLDIFVVIGRMFYDYRGSKFISFFIGTIIGEVIWIFGLTYLVRIFSYKLINNKKTFLILDIFTILIMIFIVSRIISGLLGQTIQ